MSSLSGHGSTHSVERLAVLAAVAVLAWGSTGSTATPDPVRSANAAAEAAKRAPPKAGPPPCASGEPRDDSGGCPVVDDAPATRGFELYSGMLPQRGSRAALTTIADDRPAIGAETAGCGEVCDLKISFSPGSTALTRSAKARLDQFAKAVAANAMGETRFEIGGHTDASGSPARNLALSQARAEAVTAYLGSHGVSAARLVAKGYGSDGLLLQKIPLDPRNRRVEARVLR
jgi:outer membrane protein OmpA-like peptidoglycan-associated protein